MSCCLLNVNTRLFAEWLKCSLAVNWGGWTTNMSRTFSRSIQVLCRPFSFGGICVYRRKRQNFKPHMLFTFLRMKLSECSSVFGIKSVPWMRGGCFAYKCSWLASFCSWYHGWYPSWRGYGILRNSMIVSTPSHCIFKKCVHILDGWLWNHNWPSFNVADESWQFLLDSVPYHRVSVL